MNRITTERLDELIGFAESGPVGKYSPAPDTASALRELLAYRKAVKELIAAVDARRNADAWEVGKDRWRELADLHIAAEATLRALGEK